MQMLNSRPRAQKTLQLPRDCIAFERCPQDGQASADSMGRADLTYSHLR